VICPTAQRRGLRRIGTTGKSVAVAERLSSDEQWLGHPPVMAGLAPAIHPFRKKSFARMMDARVKPAHDNRYKQPEAQSKAHHFSSVIPGQPAGLNPESMAPWESSEKWIPGSRFACPGMTAPIMSRPGSQRLNPCLTPLPPAS
jgi:hypothetical protein